MFDVVDGVHLFTVTFFTQSRDLIVAFATFNIKVVIVGLVCHIDRFFYFLALYTTKMYN
jgi:hypothetical protein